MYEIVAGIDGSERRAREQAEAIAGLPVDPDDVRVTLVHVFQDNPEGASVSQIASVRRARERLAEAGLDVHLDETSGDPASELLAVADRRDADLLCLAGRKRSPAGKAVFGSVTQSILLDTDLPVLVCGSGRGV